MNFASSCRLDRSTNGNGKRALLPMPRPSSCPLRQRSDDERITAIMSSGVTEFLVQLIATGGTNMLTPALRILGNFVSGNDMHTQAVIDAGFFTHADMLLNHPKVSQITWGHL